MSALMEQALLSINNGLAPIAPSGVTGVQFISVFLITYSIIFVVLRKVDLFSNNPNVRLIMSLVVAFFTASSALSVLLITKVFPSLGMVTTLLISFIAVIAMVPTGKKKITFAPLMTIAGLLLLIYFTWVGVSGNITLTGLSMPKLSTDEYYGLIFGGLFLLFIILIYTSGKGPKKDDKSDKLVKTLKFLFGVED